MRALRKSDVLAVEVGDELLGRGLVTRLRLEEGLEFGGLEPEFHFPDKAVFRLIDSPFFEEIHLGVVIQVQAGTQWGAALVSHGVND